MKGEKWFKKRLEGWVGRLDAAFFCFHVFLPVSFFKNCWFNLSPTKTQGFTRSSAPFKFALEALLASESYIALEWDTCNLPQPLLSHGFFTSTQLGLAQTHQDYTPYKFPLLRARTKTEPLRQVATYVQPLPYFSSSNKKITQSLDETTRSFTICRLGSPCCLRFCELSMSLPRSAGESNARFHPHEANR